MPFGSSVNPITARGADYNHHITACPPGFENLTASLHSINKKSGHLATPSLTDHTVCTLS
jgi:hypothetical protein